jgi:hypothetical protein
VNLLGLSLFLLKFGGNWKSGGRVGFGCEFVGEGGAFRVSFRLIVCMRTRWI